MNKIEIKAFDESYYFEELDNGLKVYIFHRPDFNTSYAAFGTPFGALKIKERTINEHYSFNPGIAHFLEHKLFENENLGVIAAFAQIGANVNAFTSYTETVYYFNLANQNHVLEALDMLLDFVQELKIDEEKVEKEKPIIIQELNMYLQMPETKLLNGTFNALYHHFPLKYDIGGDKDSVSRITLEELERCYELNYHPSNMALVIISPLDPALLMQRIRSNQDRKNFKKTPKIYDDDYHEPKEVCQKEVVQEMDIKASKGVYALKLDFAQYELVDILKIEIGMRFILQLLFTSINPKYQKWLDEGVINYYFGFDVNLNKDYSYLMFYGEDIQGKELKDLVDQEILNAHFDEKKFEELKRRYIGASFQEFEDAESFNISFIKDILAGVDYFKEIKIAMEFDFKDLSRIIKLIDLTNYALFDLKPKIA